MAKTDGFSEYACDVQTCGAHDFAQPDTEKAASYSNRRRYDDNGVERVIMVCSEHNSNYDKLVTACEQAYQKFEHDGSYTLATQELVDELTAQVEELTAQYEAMKKDRNSWMKKYNELNAEFEEYKRTHPDTDGGEQ